MLHRPSAVPTPAAVLRLALGEQADLLLARPAGGLDQAQARGVRLPEAPPGPCRRLRLSAAAGVCRYNPDSYYTGGAGSLEHPFVDSAGRHGRLPEHERDDLRRRRRRGARPARAAPRGRVRQGRHRRRGRRARPPARRRPRRQPVRPAPRRARRCPAPTRTGNLRVEVDERPDEEPPGRQDRELEREYRATVEEILELRGDDGRVSRVPARDPRDRRARRHASPTRPRPHLRPEDRAARDARRRRAARARRARSSASGSPSCRCAAASATTSRRAPPSSSASTSCASSSSRSARSSARTTRRSARTTARRSPRPTCPRTCASRPSARLRRLERIGDQTGESSMIRTYLDWLLAVPWGEALRGAARPRRRARGARRRPRRARGRQGADRRVPGRAQAARRSAASPRTSAPARS